MLVPSGWEWKSCNPSNVRKVFMLNYFLKVLIIPPLPVFRSKTAKTPVLMTTLCGSDTSSGEALRHCQGKYLSAQLDLKWQGGVSENSLIAWKSLFSLFNCNLVFQILPSFKTRWVNKSKVFCGIQKRILFNKFFIIKKENDKQWNHWESSLANQLCLYKQKSYKCLKN